VPSSERLLINCQFRSIVSSSLDLTLIDESITAKYIIQCIRFSLSVAPIQIIMDFDVNGQISSSPTHAKAELSSLRKQFRGDRPRADRYSFDINIFGNLTQLYFPFKRTQNSQSHFHAVQLRSQPAQVFLFFNGQCKFCQPH
jgi:hypothetical protein